MCISDYELPEAIKPLLETPADVVLSSTVGCLHYTSQQELHIVGQQPNHFKVTQSIFIILLLVSSEKAVFIKSQLVTDA